MNETRTETRSVVVEREIPHPPEKIWRALTQPHLIEEWLMKNDFKPVAGHRFNLRRDPNLTSASSSTVRCWRSSRTRHSPIHGRPTASKRRHLEPHPNEHRQRPAHGAGGFRAGSGAGLPGRQGRMAAIPCGPGAAIAANGMKSAWRNSTPGPVYKAAHRERDKRREYQ